MPVIPSSNLAVVNINDIVKRSMRLLGALAPGENPERGEIADAMMSLNSMVDSWNTEHLMVYKQDTIEKVLTAGVQEYTIGDGGDIQAARPIRIDKAKLKVTTVSPNFELPVEVLTDEQWADIRMKTLSDGYPYALGNDNAYPLSTLSLYPVPSTSDTLVLYVWNQANRFTVGDDFLLPPGYEEAITYGLAIRLAPEYGKSVPAEIADIFAGAKANIKRMNSQPVYMRCDDALTGNASAGYMSIIGGDPTI